MSILATFVAVRIRNPFGQFGQAHAIRSFGGKTACGPTSVQSILAAFAGVRPTLDELCAIVGYNRPPSKVGTSAEQLATMLGRWLHFRFLGRTRSSYKAAYGLRLVDLLKLTAKGPVVLVVDYPRYPNWKGYHGARPAPWAAPLGHAGANQFPKPAIKHWTVLAGPAPLGLGVFEPNHDSAARPERVAIDYVARAALEAAYDAGGRIACVPVRSIG